MTTKQDNKFNPQEYLTSIKGKDYLEVKWRIVWFRSEHPDWTVKTDPVAIKDNFAIFKATILDESGREIATSHKMEDKSGFGDFIEKAETGAIGRCLALCGYGTQFSPEIEEGDRIVDAPIFKPSTSPQNAPTADSKTQDKPTPTQSATNDSRASGLITEKQINYVNKLHEELGWKSITAQAFLLKAFHKKKVELLTKQEASDWIEKLQNKIEDNKKKEEEVKIEDIDLMDLEG